MAKTEEGAMTDTITPENQADVLLRSIAARRELESRLLGGLVNDKLNELDWQKTVAIDPSCSGGEVMSVSLQQYGLRQATIANQQAAAPMPSASLFQQASNDLRNVFRMANSHSSAFLPPHWRDQVPDDIQ